MGLIIGSVFLPYKLALTRNWVVLDPITLKTVKSFPKKKNPINHFSQPNSFYFKSLSCLSFVGKNGYIFQKNQYEILFQFPLAPELLQLLLNNCTNLPEEQKTKHCIHQGYIFFKVKVSLLSVILRYYCVLSKRSTLNYV